MSYATLQDLIDQFGETEVIALTDRALSGEVDAAVAATGVQAASNEMDGYFAGRFPLPLTVVPVRLKELCGDITRYKLSGAGVTATSEVRLRYKDAIRDLESIRDSKLNIGLTAGGQAAVQSASVQVVGGKRTFTQTSLGDYSR